ncbi:MAG: hypothetical protein HOV81_21860, partial [Kofleriaceae bacterium]|nr:hypothetical protein [Kofleriaceae bacterium]
MYGASDPSALVERIAPFDAALGFYDDEDPDWLEYATLRELLDQAKAMPPVDALPDVTVPLPAIAKVVGTNGTHVAPPKAKPVKTSPIRKTSAKKPTKKAAAKKPTKKAAAKKAAAKKPTKKSAAKKPMKKPAKKAKRR